MIKTNKTPPSRNAGGVLRLGGIPNSPIEGKRPFRPKQFLGATQQSQLGRCTQAAAKGVTSHPSKSLYLVRKLQPAYLVKQR
jgi:hypothetical protein